MGWHYQVVRKVCDGEERFEMHEAYPDLPRDAGEPLPITESAISPSGETIDDLRWTLKAMLEDLDRYEPVNEADYPATPPESNGESE
jgi:hypothetical protein